jgi:hypothetical protein
MKRTVVISDLHCGHVVGLTHPDFDGNPGDSRSVAYKLYKKRRQCWKWYTKRIEELQPVHLLIVNGDCIDGKGKKSGGTELLTRDRNEQVDMAVGAIEAWQPKHIVMSYGTPYHTGMSEDWEDAIAKHKRLDGLVEKIGGHDTVSVNGLIFDYKHFISSSSIPHGRFTAIAKEKLWNILWAERNEYPNADVILRSHVHYFDFCGGADWLAVVTPALQAYGSKFGTRKPSGTVDFGLIYFDVIDKENYSWKHRILRFKANRREHLLEL